MFRRTSCGFSILLTTEVVPKIFQNLNVFGDLAVPAVGGFCLLRLAFFLLSITYNQTHLVRSVLSSTVYNRIKYRLRPKW